MTTLNYIEVEFRDGVGVAQTTSDAVAEHIQQVISTHEAGTRALVRVVYDERWELTLAILDAHGEPEGEGGGTACIVHVVTSDWPEARYLSVAGATRLFESLYGAGLVESSLRAAREFQTRDMPSAPNPLAARFAQDSDWAACLAQEAKQGSQRDGLATGLLTPSSPAAAPPAAEVADPSPSEPPSRGGAAEVGAAVLQSEERARVVSVDQGGTKVEVDVSARCPDAEPAAGVSPRRPDAEPAAGVSPRRPTPAGPAGPTRAARAAALRRRAEQPRLRRVGAGEPSPSATRAADRLARAGEVPGTTDEGSHANEPIAGVWTTRQIATRASLGLFVGFALGLAVLLAGRPSPPPADLERPIWAEPTPQQPAHPDGSGPERVEPEFVPVAPLPKPDSLEVEAVTPQPGGLDPALFRLTELLDPEVWVRASQTFSDAIGRWAS